MNKNTVVKFVNRTAIAALIMAVSAVSVKSRCDADAFVSKNDKVIIDTIELEDLIKNNDYLSKDNQEDSVNIVNINNNTIRSLEDFYVNNMLLPANMVNDYAIQALISEIQSYLGKDINYRELINENGNIKAVLYNKEGKSVSVTKFINNTFFANYGEDNWFIDAYTFGSEQFNKQYYAGENDFYRSEFNNNYLVNQSVFYSNQNGDMFTISLYDEGENKMLYIIPPYKDALPISLNEDDYTILSIIMALYCNGDNLNNFLLEKDFAKILDIVAIKDIDLYYELISYDKSKTLKLKTL